MSTELTETTDQTTGQITDQTTGAPLKPRVWALGAAALLALGACMEAAMPEPADGQALFVEYCAACHGNSAKGDGPLATDLGVVPADLTLIAAHRGGSFPRAEVLSKIDGYTSADLDGPGMPEFGELLKGDELPLDTGDGVLTPTPRKMVALLEYLESIQVAD
ncbi:c-type cytochrome [Salipiger sp. CCB-MM3]|uniref:c-type cytochrome n=1 Tax=Salipiger sp. CCB-MM3 TaxID=1792508 RepID=UPI000AABE1C2